MRSKNGSDRELANLPEPTPADIAALDRAESYNVMDAKQYLAFLLSLTKDLPASRETNTDEDEPFTLL
jgi:hypothetical protein